MLFLKFLTLFITTTFYLFTFSYGETNLDTLQSAQIIFRHGARTIDKTYPKDPYRNESFWPDGFHQLTCIGKTQGFLLGKFLRERYNGFINETYNPKEIHVLSSDIDRCVQTAYSVTAGLYNNQTIHENNEDCKLIQWTSVPVHSIPVEFDNILRQKAKCPKYTWLLNDFYTNSELMKALVKENLELLIYFANNTGLDIQTTSDFSDYYDSLVIENYYNFTLPEWTKPLFNTPQANKLSTFYFRTLTFTDDLKRLRAGPIMQRLVNNFNSVIIPAKDEVPKKVNLLSGHDHTLTGIMDILGVYAEGMIVRFAAVVVLELHKTSLNVTGESLEHFEIQMYYRNQTNGEAFQLEIPKCGTPCSYKKFLEIVNPFIPDDWNSECQNLPGYYSPITSGFVWTLIAVSALAGAFILFLVIRYFYQKNQHYERI